MCKCVLGGNVNEVKRASTFRPHGNNSLAHFSIIL